MQILSPQSCCVPSISTLNKIENNVDNDSFVFNFLLLFQYCISIIRNHSNSASFNYIKTENSFIDLNLNNSLIFVDMASTLLQTALNAVSPFVSERLPTIFISHGGLQLLLIVDLIYIVLNCFLNFCEHYKLSFDLIYCSTL